MADFDPRKIAEETEWLRLHPQFEQRPASITEFLGPDYLNIEKLVRPGLKEALVAIFGEEVNGDRIALFERAMLTGAIGIGKTTFASIALPYMAHWVLCLRDPQAYFELLPGSRIAFMQMSTSRSQALKVVFGDIFARIKNSKWFVENYPHDPKFTNEIRFPKEIWILPGDSAETTFEGFNILAGILDEMDSHKETKDKDYADVGYDTIHNRISSRFVVLDDEGSEVGHKGLLICIGQMKKATGFAARKYKEFLEDSRAYVMRMTIWESFGWKRYTRKDGTHNSFWYDKRRKKIVPETIVGVVNNSDFIEIPNAYRKDFENNPEKALRDLAGIPPEVSDPFISMVDKITLCVTRWKERHGDESPVGPELLRPVFAPWFRGDNDPRRRHIHVDMAYSGDGDSLGIGMGHVEELVEIEDELKPYIVMDCLIRIRAHSGGEIFLPDVRRIIYQLKDELHFRIVSVSMDGFQSTESLQQLQKKRFHTEYVSIDKSTLPYEDLREAIYDERFEFPPFLTHATFGDDKLIEIGVQELSQLQDDGKKIDHPVGGSKDVADTMAGVCYRLMGDRTYRKGVTSLRTSTAESMDDLLATGTGSARVLTLPGLGGNLQAPIPPLGMGLGLRLNVPDRLKSNGKRR